MYSISIGRSRSVFRRALVATLSGALAVSTVTAITIQNSDAATSSGILTRSGSQLVLNGQTYKYVAFNAYGLTGQEIGTPYSASAMDSYFQSLPTNSLTRTWAWKNNGTSGVDLAVQRAEANNQMLILSLSEGAGYDHLGSKTPEWFANGYKSDLLPWINQIVPMYKNSPAVGMWEIMNEPGNKNATTGNVSPSVMKSFFDTVAAEIKKNDPNHLVETGTMDASQYGTTDFGNLHSGPNIDVASVHEYADDYEGGVTVSGNYTRAINALRDAGISKPLIVGEAGITAGDGCKNSRQQRVSKMQQKFDAYFAQGTAPTSVDS